MNHLAAAIEAMDKAEALVMSYFSKDMQIGKDIRLKARANYVTDADIASEKMIIEVLGKHFPGYGFIVEETGNRDEGAEYLWIIDPIDGTTNFSHNYPFFSISIALYRKNVPIAGVVSSPCMRERFIAEKGKGSFLNGKTINVSKQKEMRDSLISTGFPGFRFETGEDNTGNLKRILNVAADVRRSGSAAMDICYVACGRLEGYWEMDLKRVDSAAARLILEEAGGMMTDFDGKPLDKAFSNIAASNGLIHNGLLKCLRKPGD